MIDTTTSESAPNSRARTNNSRSLDRLLLWGTLLTVFAIRVAYLKPIQNFDAQAKWMFVRQWLEDGHLPHAARAFTHHHARWAINLPIAATQLVFGQSVVGYYFLVLCVGLAQAVLAFRVGSSVAGPWVGALATLAYSAMPKMGYLGSQLMPECFESTYVLGALYGLQRAELASRAPAISGNRQVQKWLVSVVVFMILGWLTRETFLFFIPGLLLVAWSNHRTLRVPVVLGAGFASFVALETLAYRLKYGFPAGRLTIVQSHHFGSGRIRKPITSPLQLLERYADLPAVFDVLFFGALLATAYWLWMARGRLREALLQPLGQVLLVAWLSYFLHTFGLRSFDPPRLIQPPNDRYLMPGAPMLAIGLFAILRSVLGHRLTPLPLGIRVAAFAATLVAAVIVSGVAGNLHRWGPPLALQYESQLRAAFDAGTPIFAKRKPWHTLTTACAYLRGDQLDAVTYTTVTVGRRKVGVLLNKRSRAWSKYVKFGALSSRGIAKLRKRSALEVQDTVYLRPSKARFPKKW